MPKIATIAPRTPYRLTSRDKIPTVDTIPEPVEEAAPPPPSNPVQPPIPAPSWGGGFGGFGGGYLGLAGINPQVWEALGLDPSQFGGGQAPQWPSPYGGFHGYGNNVVGINQNARQFGSGQFGTTFLPNRVIDFGRGGPNFYTGHNREMFGRGSIGLPSYGGMGWAGGYGGGSQRFLEGGFGGFGGRYGGFGGGFTNPWAFDRRSPRAMNTGRVSRSDMGFAKRHHTIGRGGPFSFGGGWGF